MVVEVY